MGHHGNSFLSFAEPVGEIGGWIELGRTTLGATSDIIDVTSFSDKRYYMVLTNGINSGVLGLRTRVGTTTIDTGSNYARRISNNGGADSTAINQSFADLAGFDQAVPNFQVAYTANLSANEKLIQGWSINGQASGDATAPQRTEGVAKWVNTAAPLQSWRSYNASTGDFASGSEVVVLGWDPTDTHTTNFWEVLADVDLSTGIDNVIESGTFTAKKYLWIQFSYTVDGTNGNERFRFNADTAGNYSNRYSVNGAADSTQTGDAFIYARVQGNQNNTVFVNSFVINNSANEKLAITHNGYNNTDGAANAPIREEIVGKWANTAAQITSFDIIRSAGNFEKDSFLKVWGSN